MFLTFKYYCPKCRVLLNKNEYVELLVFAEEDCITKIRFNPKPGAYDYTCDPPIEFDKGSKLNFHCTDCKTDLQSPQFPDFASIIMKPGEQISFEVLFDRTAGQHATYVMTEDMVERDASHPQDLL